MSLDTLSKLSNKELDNAKNFKAPKTGHSEKPVDFNLLESRNLFNKGEWQNRLTDKEFKNLIPKRKNNEKDYHFKERFEKFFGDKSINESTRILKQLEDKKFIKNIDKESVQNIKNLCIKQIYSLLIEMREIPQEKGVSRAYKINETTINNLTNFLEETSVLNTEEKTPLLKYIIDTYSSKNDYNKYIKIFSKELDLIGDNYESILLNKDCGFKLRENDAEPRKNYFDMEIQSNSFFVLLNKESFQEFLLKNQELIKNNFIDSYENYAEKLNNIEKLNAGVKDKYLLEYKEISRKIIIKIIAQMDKISESTSKNKLTEAYKNILEDIDEDCDKILLKNPSIGQHIIKNTARGEFSNIVDEFDFDRQLDSSGINSKKYRGQFKDFRNMRHEFDKTSNLFATEDKAKFYSYDNFLLYFASENSLEKRIDFKEAINIFNKFDSSGFIGKGRLSFMEKLINTNESNLKEKVLKLIKLNEEEIKKDITEDLASSGYLSETYLQLARNRELFKFDHQTINSEENIKAFEKGLDICFANGRFFEKHHAIFETADILQIEDNFFRLEKMHNAYLNEVNKILSSGLGDKQIEQIFDLKDRFGVSDKEIRQVLVNSLTDLWQSNQKDKFIEAMENRQVYHLDQEMLKSIELGKKYFQILSNPQYLDLMSATSPLSNYKSKVLIEMLNSDDWKKKLTEYKNIFLNGQSSFYQKCIKVVEINLKKEMARDSHSKTDVTHYWLDLFGPEGKPEKIVFDELDMDKKLKLLEYILKYSERLSQSQIMKKIASDRNIRWIQSFYENGKINKNIKINILNNKNVACHGTDCELVQAIFKYGNFSGECIYESSKPDSAILHVDLSEVTEANLDKEQKKIINSLGASGYGDGTILVYRTPENQAQDIDSKVYYYDFNKYPELANRQDLNLVKGGKHVGVLGAIPSTEISAIIINLDNEEKINERLEKIKLSMIENEVYMPVLNSEGHLLYAPSDFEKDIKDYKIYNNIGSALNDPDFYTKVLQEKYGKEFPELLESLDTTYGQGGIHKFTKKEHMENAIMFCDKINESYGYNLEKEKMDLVKIAAKMHDIAKMPEKVQLIDNTTTAAEILNKSFSNLHEKDKRTILLMIREDELLGDLLAITHLDENGNLISTNEDLKNKFKNLFKSNDPDYSEEENDKLTAIYQKMMICMYKADIMAIDDGEIYKKEYTTPTGEKKNGWAIDEKLKALGLDYE